MAWEVVFQGSLMDGVDVDLVQWCGLPPLSDEQNDRLWGEINEQDLIELCASAEILPTGEIDEVAGQSDEYYQVEVENVGRFKQELRNAITDIIDES